MKVLKILNKLLLVLTGHLAGYMIISGIEGMHPWTIFFYTVGFGVLVLSCLLLLLFGFEVLEKSMVVVVAALVPMGLAAGVIVQYFPGFHFAALLLMLLGLALILLSRFKMKGKSATLLLAMVHGISGLALFTFPIILSLTHRAPGRFAMVGLGGALVGLGGLLLAFLNTGAAILSKEKIFTLFPWLLALMSAAFVAGF